jgi:glycogen synthase
MAVPLYAGMVASLAAALARAGETYRSQPDVYARMLANLYRQATRFSWEKTAQEYERVYRMAVM